MPAGSGTPILVAPVTSVVTPRVATTAPSGQESGLEGSVGGSSDSAAFHQKRGRRRGVRATAAGCCSACTVSVPAAAWASPSRDCVVTVSSTGFSGVCHSPADSVACKAV